MKKNIGLSMLWFLLIGMVIGLLGDATSTQAQSSQRMSLMITRGNLNAFDDAEQQRAFNRVKERSNGLLDVQTVFAGSLPIKSNDWLRAVSLGDLDMAMLVGDYHAADFPLLGLIQTPWLCNNQVEKNLVIEATFPIMEREANKQNIHLLGCRPYAEVGFWTTKPLKSILDVGGTKLRAQAKLYSDITEAIKGVPTPVEWAETYTALQRGLVNGLFTGFDSFTGAKMMEVAPYAHRIFLSNQFVYLGINKKKWDGLPPNVQLIVMEELSRAYVTIQAYVPQLIDDEIAKQKAGGLKGYDPEPPEGWFKLMNEKITKPTLVQELKKSGAVGQELVKVVERALGRSIQ